MGHDLADAVLPQLLAKRGPMDTQHLGRRRSIILTLIQDGPDQRRLDQFEEPLMERGIVRRAGRGMDLFPSPLGEPALQPDSGPAGRLIRTDYCRREVLATDRSPRATIAACSIAFRSSRIFPTH